MIVYLPLEDSDKRDDLGLGGYRNCSIREGKRERPQDKGKNKGTSLELIVSKK